MEEMISISKINAVKAFKLANKDGKKLIQNILGKPKGFFVDTITIFERIKTFSDVCAEAGVDEFDYSFDDVEGNDNYAQKYLKRLRLIARVFNGDWRPNIADTSQYKYYPWFRVIPDASKPSGFGLSCGGYGCAYVITHVGVRPFFKDQATAEHVGKLFVSEYGNYAYYDNLCA